MTTLDLRFDVYIFNFFQITDNGIFSKKRMASVLQIVIDPSRTLHRSDLPHETRRRRHVRARVRDQTERRTETDHQRQIRSNSAHKMGL